MLSFTFKPKTFLEEETRRDWGRTKKKHAAFDVSRMWIFLSFPVFKRMLSLLQKQALKFRESGKHAFADYKVFLTDQTEFTDNQE